MSMTNTDKALIVIVFNLLVLSAGFISKFSSKPIINVQYKTIDKEIILKAEKYHGSKVEVKLIDGQTYYFIVRDGKDCDIFTSEFKNYLRKEK